MMPSYTTPQPSPITPQPNPTTQGAPQGMQLHPAVAQAFRQRIMSGRTTGPPGGQQGSNPWGATSGSGAPPSINDGSTNNNGGGFYGTSGGALPLGPGGQFGGQGLLGQPGAAQPHQYTQADMNYGQPQQNNAPGSQAYSANGRPNPQSWWGSQGGSGAPPPIDDGPHPNDPPLDLFMGSGLGGPQKNHNPWGAVGGPYGPPQPQPGGPINDDPINNWNHGGGPLPLGPGQGGGGPFGIQGGPYGPPQPQSGGPINDNSIRSSHNRNPNGPSPGMQPQGWRW